MLITVLLYSPGDLTILGGVTITLNSNGASPQFTFTCISTGGPATNVIWIRDNFDVVTEGTETVLNDRMTLQYTHTLTVTETTSFNGTYSCIVFNDKPSFAGVIIKTTVIGYGNVGYYRAPISYHCIYQWLTSII